VRGTDPEDVDTDGDKFPDGYEVLWGTNPRVPQASVADTTSPALVGPARVVFATSNTVKIEFETNEFTRIYLGLDGGPPIQRLPLGKPGDWKHWVVLENLEPDREYVVDLVMRDPAHNYRTDSTTRVRTAPRALPIPTRVTDIRSSIVLAEPTYVAEVDVRRGDVPVGAGYRVSGALHRWEFGALLPTVVAELADAPTNAAGRAQVRVSLGAIPPTPGTLYFVLKDVVPPPGGAPYARAGSVEVFDSIVY
jgi:hypothetical protein